MTSKFVKGIYIWEFELNVAWSYDEEDVDGEGETYAIASATFADACAKVLKIALSPSRKFTEVAEDDNGKDVKYTHYPVRAEITKCERGNWIDG